MKYEFTTDIAAEGMRIDACIRRFLPEVPQRTVQQSFTRRDVKLDGKRVKPDIRVFAGQKVELFCMEQTTPLVDVVYEDEDVLLINKSCETSVNIESHVDFMIIHSSDSDTQTQARGRYRNDLRQLYLYADWALYEEKIEIPKDKMNVRLFKDDITLCSYS